MPYVIWLTACEAPVFMRVSHSKDPSTEGARKIEPYVKNPPDRLGVFCTMIILEREGLSTLKENC